MKLTESQLYGPIGKAGWDAIEAEIERQCEAAGLTPLQRYEASFTLDLNTGKLTMDSHSSTNSTEKPHG